MAIMRRELPNGVVRMRPRRSGLTAHPVMSAALAVLLILVIYQLLNGVVFWAQVRLDDLRYGYPRSSQLEGYVGFGESSGLPTHFIALNLHRQVVILYMSGDDPSHVTAIKGPYLFGADEEYAPVTMQLVDVTGDGYPDLVVSVDHQRLLYIDDPHAGIFRPATPAERAAAAPKLGSQP